LALTGSKQAFLTFIINILHIISSFGFITNETKYDYRNRVYSASLGRFLQTDPIRFEAGDTNLYRYVGNMSAKFTDPEGLLSGPQNGDIYFGYLYVCKASVNLKKNPISPCPCSLSSISAQGIGLSRDKAEQAAMMRLIEPEGCWFDGLPRIDKCKREAFYLRGLPA
jgi:RHS repeat-associated protein